MRLVLVMLALSACCPEAKCVALPLAVTVNDESGNAVSSCTATRLDISESATCAGGVATFSTDAAGEIELDVTSGTKRATGKVTVTTYQDHSFGCPTCPQHSVATVVVR